jgi:queuine/archaeosine tRNA-ribosyltransferase
MSEPCPICSAKDKEMFHMTAHIGRLTQMMSEDHHIILDLRQEILTMRTIMTDEQMKELRELLLKAQHKGETK